MPAELRPQSALRPPGRYAPVEASPNTQPLFVHPRVEFNPELGKSCAFPSLPIDHEGRTPNQAFADLSRVMRRVLEPRMEPKPSSHRNAQDESSGDEFEARQYNLVGPSKEKRHAFVTNFLDRAAKKLGDDMATFEAVEIQAAAQQAMETGGGLSPNRRASVVALPNKGSMAPAHSASAEDLDYLSFVNWGSDDEEENDNSSSRQKNRRLHLYPPVQYTWKDVPDNVKLVIIKELTTKVTLEQAVAEVLKLTADEFNDFLALYKSEQYELAKWTISIQRGMRERERFMLLNQAWYFENWNLVQHDSYDYTCPGPKLITNFISSEDMKIGQAYLRSNALGPFAESLAGWVGHAKDCNFKIDMASRYIEVDENRAASVDFDDILTHTGPNAFPLVSADPPLSSVDPRQLFINPPFSLPGVAYGGQQVVEGEVEGVEELETHEALFGDQEDVVMAGFEEDDEPIRARSGGKEKPPSLSPPRAPVVTAQPATLAMDLDISNQPTPVTDVDVEEVPDHSQPADVVEEAYGYAEQPGNSEQPAGGYNMSPSKSNRPTRQAPAATTGAVFVIDNSDDEDYQPTKRLKRKRQPSVSNSNQDIGGQQSTAPTPRRGGSGGNKGGSGGRKGGSGGNKGGSGGNKRPPAKKTKVSHDAVDQPAATAPSTTTTNTAQSTATNVVPAPPSLPPPPSPQRPPARSWLSWAAREGVKRVVALIQDQTSSTIVTQTEQTVAHAQHVLEGSAKLDIDAVLGRRGHHILMMEASRLNLAAEAINRATAEVKLATAEVPPSMMEKLAEIAKLKVPEKTMPKTTISVGPIRSAPQKQADPVPAKANDEGTVAGSVSENDERSALPAPMPTPALQPVLTETTLWEAKPLERFSGLKPIKPFIVMAGEEFSKSAPLMIDGRSIFHLGYLGFEPGQVILVSRVGEYSSSPHLDMYYGQYTRSDGSLATGCFPKARAVNIENSLEKPSLFYVLPKNLSKEAKALAWAEDDFLSLNDGEYIAILTVDGGDSGPAVYYGQAITKDGPGPSGWISALLVTRCGEIPPPDEEVSLTQEQPQPDEGADRDEDQAEPDDYDEVSLIEIPSEEFYAARNGAMRDV